MRRFLLISGVLLTAAGAFAQVKFLKSFYLNSPGDPTVSHNGKFLYVCSQNDIIVYEINTKNGELTKRSSYRGSDEFSDLSLSPDDRFLYIQTHERINGESVSKFLTFSCDPITAKLDLKSTLSQQDGTRFEYTATQHFLPQGNLMFISTRWHKDLYIYRRNSVDGSFTYLNCIRTENPNMFNTYSFSPDGKFMYVNFVNVFNEVGVFSVDGNTGQLTQVQEVVNPIYPDDYAQEVMISTDGKNAYSIHTDPEPTSEYRHSDITQYSRDPYTGMLTFQKHYPELKKDGEITELYMDGSGEFLYALRAFGTGDPHAMFVFKRNPLTGDITKQQTFLDGYPANYLKGIFQMDFSNDNRFIYATSARDYHLNIFENTNAKGSAIFTKPATAEIGATDDGFEWEYVNEPVNETNYPVYNNSHTQNPTPATTVQNDPITETVINKDQFDEIWKKLKDETSDTKRFDLCYELLEGKSLKTVQIASLAMLFSSEYKRLEFVKFTSYFVKDKENFKLLGDLFTYDSIKQDFFKLPM